MNFTTTSIKKIAKYETKRWSEIGDWVLDNLKTFKELIDLNNELNDETDD